MSSCIVSTGNFMLLVSICTLFFQDRETGKKTAENTDFHQSSVEEE